MFIKYIKYSHNVCSVFLNSICKCYTSSLYVTGDRGREVFSAVSPHIDLDEKLGDLPKLKKMLQLRGREMNVDRMKNLWDILKSVECEKEKLNERNEEILRAMAPLRNKTDTDSQVELNKWKLQRDIVREDLKMMMKHIWELEKETIVKGLLLPNYLHVDTPAVNPKIIRQFNEMPVSDGTSHIERGTKLDMLDFRGASCYYLKGEAALFEFNYLHTLAEELCASGFTQFSNPDLGWSVAIEGVGLNHKDPASAFILEDEDETEANDDHKLYLVGGASLIPFCSYHAKILLLNPVFPLKYFTLGHTYKPRSKCKSNLPASLFNAWQTSAIECFLLTSENYEEMMDEFYKCLDKIIKIYEQLDIHFRVVYMPANSLAPWESLRASVQMYSPCLKSYVEVGNLSIGDDFISKRILMCYNSGEDDEKHFTRVLTGTLTNMSALIGCILEYENPRNIFKKYL